MVIAMNIIKQRSVFMVVFIMLQISEFSAQALLMAYGKCYFLCSHYNTFCLHFILFLEWNHLLFVVVFNKIVS